MPKKTHALNVCWADASAVSVEWLRVHKSEMTAKAVENIRKFGVQFQETKALTTYNNLLPKVKGTK